jgi:hypothetical protein
LYRETHNRTYVQFARLYDSVLKVRLKICLNFSLNLWRTRVQLGLNERWHNYPVSFFSIIARAVGPVLENHLRPVGLVLRLVMKVGQKFA